MNLDSNGLSLSQKTYSSSEYVMQNANFSFEKQVVGDQRPRERLKIYSAN